MTGFLTSAGGRFELGDVTIESKNDYAAISVVSLDGKPLHNSRRILVQVGTTARLTGWKTKPVEFDFKESKIQGEQIVHSGRPPWRIANTQATISLRNTFIEHAQRVTLAGRDGGAIPMKQDEHGCTIRLPSDAMYVVLASE